MPDYDDFSTLAEILGIRLSVKNHIRNLWNQHCSSITAISFDHNADKFNENALEQIEEKQNSMNSKDMLIDILNAIRENEVVPAQADYQEQLDWLDGQILVLKLILADIDLRLRYPSLKHDIE